ncbi:unnamed protein product [Mytilus coruscus]|uniref:Uncharacterized protein n=1 Tax=Mytilus coruscus TaxID=42192 RepID=A0A6J8DRD3_MYTCO|nr:unnamed protein product [Mytilus coruscus]
MRVLKKIILYLLESNENRRQEDLTRRQRYRGSTCTCRYKVERLFFWTKYYNGDDYYRGGPSYMLCLPDHPELSNNSAGGKSFICGSEYDDSQFGSGAQNQYVLFSVCLSNASRFILIPGRKSCFSGWRIEYNGIRASNAYHHAASSYVCIDIQLEFIPGRSDNNDNTIFTTGYKCGSLPCPPYTDDVVCCVFQMN